MKKEVFNFSKGDIIGGKYYIEKFLGKGWEGEVYLAKEIETNIERTLKFFYPKRDKGNKASKFYAKKLHKLKNCSIIIQYYGQDIFFHDKPITYLVSEFIDGELLSEFLKRKPGKRLSSFAALHLLHALAKGMDEVHRMREYHGDLHTDNIIVQRVGLGFELKLLDLYHWGAADSTQISDDVVDLIKIFHEVLGGRKYYSKLPPEVKDIICGLRRDIIKKKFRTAGKLKEYLENMNWN